MYETFVNSKKSGILEMFDILTFSETAAANVQRKTIQQKTKKNEKNMGTFKDLRIWQEGINLAFHIYELTKRQPFNRDFGLRDQIQRAVVSISSNISEGEERGSDRAAVYFLNIARASCAEVVTQLHIAYRIGYITQEELLKYENDAQKIIASIRKLIRSKGGNNPMKYFSWLIIGLFFPL